MKSTKAAVVVLALHFLLFMGVLCFWQFSSALNRMDCRMLIGGWHPDIQQEVILEHCQLPKNMT